MKGGPIQLLLVEDNAADVRLTREALRDAVAQYELHVASNGVEALAFLHSEPPFAGRSWPDLVLLDLNLPGLSGLEVLTIMKQDPLLRSIPVSILSTSGAAADVLSAYDLGANCYIVKPVGFDEVREVVAAIDRFWFGAVRLPTRVG
ncbi:MAG: hypothetical protein QOD72_761 [Acidimicrobiaceae bacterium]|jgi:two-component system response regulator|nr:hypothetical protein [Acidimicrobiaceae bacterium]